MPVIDRNMKSRKLKRGFGIDSFMDESEQSATLLDLSSYSCLWITSEHCPLSIISWNEMAFKPTSS